MAEAAEETETARPSSPARRSMLLWPAGRQGLALAAILLICLVARMGWTLHVHDVDPGALRTHDTPTYAQPALALVRDGSFNTHPGSDVPMFVRSPGYPAFLAAVFAVSDDSETAVLIVQVLLSVALVWLAFAVAARLWGVNVGLVAAVLVAANPLQAAAAGYVLTELLTAVLLLIAVAIGFRAFAARPVSAVWPALLGLTLALAILVRPSAYYLMLLPLAILIVLAVRSPGARRWAGVVTLLVPLVLVVGGWQARNHSEVGSWRVAGIEAHGVYSYLGAGVIAQTKGISLLDAQVLLDHDLPLPPGLRNQGAYYDHMYARGVDIVLDHPVEAAKDYGAGLFRVVAGNGSSFISTYFQIDVPLWLDVVLGLALAAFWVAAIWGAALALARDRMRRAGHVFALGVVAYTLLTSGGPAGYSRFRVPVEPILTLYAAWGAVSAGRAIRARRPQAERVPLSSPGAR